MDVTSGAWTAYPSGAPKFTPGFSGVCVTLTLVLYVYFVDRCSSFCPVSIGHCVVCTSLFLLAIVLYVLLRFTDSDYPLGIFRLVLLNKLISVFLEGFSIGNVNSYSWNNINLHLALYINSKIMITWWLN